MPDDARSDLIRAIAEVLNYRSRENVSNTPDFMLAEVAVSAIEAWERATRERDKWYGVVLGPGLG